MSTADTITASATPRTGSGPSAMAQEDSEAATKEVYANLSNALKNLAVSYDALHEQTVQVASLGDELGATQDVKQFRQQMKDQDMRHKEGMNEIQNIIDQILQNGDEDMGKQISQELVDQIDEIVKEQVAQCLKDHLPEDLQQELARDKREYEDLQLALHNSESRRLNGTLRANKPDSVLHTIYMSNGSISPRFPKDLRSLFELDAETIKSLLVDYGVNGISDMRDTNLNKLMQLCGVRYQLVV